MSGHQFRMGLTGVLLIGMIFGVLETVQAEGDKSPWHKLEFQDDAWFFAAPGKTDEYQFAFVQLGQRGIEAMLHPGEGFIGYTSDLIASGTGPVYVEADVMVTSSVIQLGLAGINADGPSYGFLSGTMNVAIPISSRGFDSKGTLSLLVKPEGGYLSIAVQAVLPVEGHSPAWAYVKVLEVRYSQLSELSADEAMAVLTSVEWSTPTPTLPSTSTPTGTVTPTEIEMIPPTITPTATDDPNASPTVTPTPTATDDPNASPTATITPTLTVTPTPTGSPSTTVTATPTLHTISEIVVSIPGLAEARKKLTMVLIPAGTFLMGSPGSERSRSINEGPQHEVTISRSFYLGKYEVTQAQWEAIMGTNPSIYTGKTDCPVESVSWMDCQTFIEKMNALGLGIFRLPTEAEWEYACRAGKTTRYSFGDATDCDDGCVTCETLAKYLWWCGNKGQSNGPREVGLLSANPWGLFDMHGNVWEWCSSRYGAYTAGPKTDPTGPEVGSSRIARGGDWSARAQYCRSATRYSAGENYRDGGVGLRLVREVE